MVEKEVLKKIRRSFIAAIICIILGIAVLAADFYFFFSWGGPAKIELLVFLAPGCTLVGGGIATLIKNKS